MWRTTGSLCVMALLAGCVATGASSTPDRERGMFGIEKADVIDDTPKAFAGKQRVVIGDFKVGFLTHSTARAKATGGFSGGGSSNVSAVASLEGVSSDTFQQLTEAAYRDFVSDLEANGYEVVDRSTLTSHSAYKKANTREAPYEFDDSPFVMGAELVYHTPEGFDLHMHPRDGETHGLGWSNPASAFADFAEKTDLPVLNVNLLVDFVNEEGVGGARDWAMVSIAPGLSITPGSSVQIIGGHSGTFSNTVGSVTLGQPVYTTDGYATNVEEVTSGAQKAGNVFAALGGLGKKTTAYEITADADNYQNHTRQLLTEANDKLINHMASLR